MSSSSATAAVSSRSTGRTSPSTVSANVAACAPRRLSIGSARRRSIAAYSSRAAASVAPGASRATANDETVDCQPDHIGIQ